MFPTFISILDIQSWWEVPSIAHFCSLFRSAFNLLDFDIEDLEEALLTDGTEENSWLQELIVRLLTGCLPNNEISTFNYQMFLRRLFREKCKEHDRYNPFNTDIDFQLLPLRTKVDILHALCDFRLDADDVLDQLKNLEADSLRVEPLGYDDNDSAYWYFYGTRLYREDFKTKNNKKGKSVWQVVCFTEDDWFQLAKKFKKSQSKAERQLYRTLTENFLPELPRLFCEKERLARKRLLENQPRRTSSRLDTKRKQEQEQADKAKQDELEAEKKKVEGEEKDKKDLKKRRQEAYERRARIREKEQSDTETSRPQHSDTEISRTQQSDSEASKTRQSDTETSKTRQSDTEASKTRHEMAGHKKSKKSKAKQRQNSYSSSSSSRDRGSSSTRSQRSESKGSRSADKRKKVPAAVGGSTTVGRQTNNSLASATGQIVIQSVSNPHRKKLKTSQVFCQTDEDLQTGMHKILDHVKDHEDAWPFIDPVEEDFAPNYYSIIRKPMDLQRMEERLDSGYYKTFSRFRGDFQLIVDNCRLYNGVDNEYTEMVGNLLKVFEKATERYLDQVTSSDDEIAVEYPEAVEEGQTKKKINTSRKPTLAAQTDKKRDASEDSKGKRSNSLPPEPKVEKKKAKEETKPTKKNTKKGDEKPEKKKNKKTVRVGRKAAKYESPARSRSRSRSLSSLSRGGWSSSPPPSWPPSSPESNIGSKKKNLKSSHLSDEEVNTKSKGREKQKEKTKDSRKDDAKADIKNSKTTEKSPSPPKPKDKHNKLRETIEKLKAKSEISSKLKDCDDSDTEKTKENRSDQAENKSKKHETKNSQKSSTKRRSDKRSLDLEDENSAAESIQSDNNKKHCKKESKNSGTKNAAIEALTLATEQTLKDINKWLDDTPRLSEFSSASNSPSHYIGGEEFDNIGSKIENDYRKKFDKPLPRKDALGKDIKRRPFHRDPTKFLNKKREVQRTIDRLQPGKSKGNLLSNIQNANKVDDMFPLGPLSKIKDSKNSLIVKTDQSTPKLSLGSVLDSFGKHKFVDDVKKEEERDTSTIKTEISNSASKLTSGSLQNEPPALVKPKTEEGSDQKIGTSPGKATPNLSAWFKAFGAPKVPPNQKKAETKAEEKAEKTEEAKQVEKKEETRKITPPEISPNPDSPMTPQGQPAQRQRKMSTGSTVSERSSFSQDMDSPRVGIDERLGAYPAPYPSPLHRSPSGASPNMTSPRPDVSPKSTFPTVNGQIRVGFYQDTVSTKSSPEKSCSPRDNPQSPYPQYSEHVYTPSTTENAPYSYSNTSYYSQINYSNSSAVSSYNPEQNNQPAYYDTNKPLTDQYQAKTAPNYHAVNSPNFQNVNSPNYSSNSPSQYSPTANSPGYHQSNSPVPNQMPSPAAQPSFDNFRQHQQQQPQQQPARIPEKQQTAMFPVKKRAYNESEAPPLNAGQQDQAFDRTFELGLAANRQLNVGASQTQEARPSSRNTPQQYVHQNIPNPRATASGQTQEFVVGNNPPAREGPLLQPNTTENVHGNFSAASSNLYNYEGGYPVNPERPLDLNARPEGEKKIDMTKYASVNYNNTDVAFARNAAQYNLNYGRTIGKPEIQAPTAVSAQNIQNSEMMMRYNDSVSLTPDMNAQKAAHVNTNMPQNAENRLNPALDVSGGYKQDMAAISRATYNVDQSLSLRGNLPNLSHIVDRFSSENMYYGEKSLGAAHIYSKPMVTSAASLPMFTQPSMAYDMQSQYNRQIGDLQASKAPTFNQQLDKKSKKRKSSRATATPTSEPSSSASNQGFQSYTGLKTTSTMEPSAISLKTTSVVPGSAFNFGPAPTGLGLSSGLYDKDTYPNFLEEYRAAPNYYMAAAAAAAHHRTTPETGDNKTRTAHQPASSSGYPFIGAPQPRPPSYPLSGPFIPPHQAAPLMDASSPLYQQYLQAGVLHQGLLGPPGAYPPGYHPALSMRQPFDSMTRPSWL